MTKPLLAIVFIAGFLISCTDKSPEQTTKSVDSTHDKVPDDVDKNFETFILKFSKDSLFQIGRIKFPLRVQELELSDSSFMTERTIEVNEHRTMDFSPPKFKDNIDNYTQAFKIKGNKATIEIRGIDNGIIIDIYFEKIDGKWMLISWTDSST